MSAARAPQRAREASVKRGSPEWWASLSPHAFVTERTLGDVGRAESYSPSERLVLLAIAKRFNAEGAAFMTHEDLAKRTGLAVRSVKHVLAKHREGPEPLVEWTSGNGRHGRANDYRLIRANPAAFVSARDKARSEGRGPEARKRAGKGAGEGAMVALQDSPDTGTLELVPSQVISAEPGGNGCTPEGAMVALEEGNGCPPRLSLKTLLQESPRTQTGGRGGGGASPLPTEEREEAARALLGLQRRHLEGELSAEELEAALAALGERA